MKTLPLHDAHETLKPRFGDFAGWQMPLFYTNAAQEHTAVREASGIFDISHMGQVFVEGAGAEIFLNALFTNDVSRLKVGRSHYSFLLNAKGGVIDDLLLYRLEEQKFFIVFNGARIEEAEQILRAEQRLHPQVTISRELEVIGISIQGPEVATLAPSLVGSAIPDKRNFLVACKSGVLATTGYTGEHGFEWFGDIESGKALWKEALAQGVTPCGLVARDSLRLEAGLPLNGQDLGRDRSPLSAGLTFAVKLKKESFQGKEALENGAFSDSILIGFESSGPIPRPGYIVVDSQGNKVGEVTSGGRPPSYKTTIGIAWVKKEFTSQPLELKVREKTFPLTIVKLPFLKK